MHLKTLLYSSSYFPLVGYLSEQIVKVSDHHAMALTSGCLKGLLLVLRVARPTRTLRIFIGEGKKSDGLWNRILIWFLLFPGIEAQSWEQDCLSYCRVWTLFPGPWQGHQTGQRVPGVPMTPFCLGSLVPVRRPDTPSPSHASDDNPALI